METTSDTNQFFSHSQFGLQEAINYFHSHKCLLKAWSMEWPSAKLNTVKVGNPVSLEGLSPSHAPWKWQKSPRSFSNYDIVQRLRSYNLYLPLSLKFNAIVDEPVAVVVAVAFPKLSYSDTLTDFHSVQNIARSKFFDRFFGNILNESEW